MPAANTDLHTAQTSRGTKNEKGSPRHQRSGACRRLRFPGRFGRVECQGRWLHGTVRRLREFGLRRWPQRPTRRHRLEAGRRDLLRAVDHARQRHQDRRQHPAGSRWFHRHCGHHRRAVHVHQGLVRRGPAGLDDRVHPVGGRRRRRRRLPPHPGHHLHRESGQQRRPALHLLHAALLGLPGRRVLRP